MVDFALSENKIIGMIQTNEKNDLYKVGCIGKISAFEKTSDGRYIINLAGKNYFNVLKEVPTNKKFRIIEAKIYQNNNEEDYAKFDKKTLLDKYLKFIGDKNLEINYESISSINPDVLVKFIAMSSPFSNSDKQMLLETFNLNELSEKLIALFDFYQNVKKHGKSIN